MLFLFVAYLLSLKKVDNTWSVCTYENGEKWGNTLAKWYYHSAWKYEQAYLALGMTTWLRDVYKNWTMFSVDIGIFPHTYLLRILFELSPHKIFADTMEIKNSL